MERFATLQKFIQELIETWNDVRPTRMAAALAYYGMFSFVPVVYITLRVAGFFISDVILSEQVFERMTHSFGTQTAEFIQDMVLATESVTSGGSTLATLVSVGALLYAASSMFTHLKISLNMIWKVPPSVSGGIVNFIKNRLLAFVLVIGLGVTVIVAAFASLVTSTLSSILPYGYIDPILSAAGLIAMVTLAFAVLFKVLPDIKIPWRDVWLGALVTAVFVSIGVWGIGFYFSISGVGNAFEAAGALAIILIWIYYIAQIFLAGAVFTKVYSSVFGSNPTITKNA
jgi:membrane protein